MEPVCAIADGLVPIVVIRVSIENVSFKVNYIVPVFEQCVPVGSLGTEVCGRLQYEECKIVVDMSLQAGALETEIYNVSYSVADFLTQFTSDMCAFDSNGCDICLFWTNLNVRSTIIVLCY